MNTLTAEDFVVLKLALDMLSRHTDGEIAKARWKGSNAKKLSLLTMRQQIINARSKIVRCREVPS